ncbi:MAG: hypothetical protein EOP06_26305 [Proteobacteria bacterium]|nr:MAG: hypothetical protein EOP06_26305 [Pseudomonadota bacterium]
MAVAKSAFAGTFTMALFWLGTLPALSAVPSLIRSGIANSSLVTKKVGGWVLIAAAVYSIASFYIFQSA